MPAPRLLGRRADARPRPAIDRLSPMDRPASLPAGFQTWRDLLYLHWPIPADTLRPHVPGRLTIDRFDGKAYVSIVCFRSVDSRPSFAPAGLGMSWDEVNVRTYVHRNGAEPGIYFLSIDASSALASIGMRLGQGVPARRALVEHRHEDGRLVWSCERPGARFSVTCQLGGREGACEPGTLEHFLVERYFLHVDRAGTLWSSRIHHAPIDLQRARALEIDEHLLSELGLPEREGQPLVHYAREVKTEIFLPSVHVFPLR